MAHLRTPQAPRHPHTTPPPLSSPPLPLRVHSLSVPIVTDLADLYNGADAAALACLTAKLAVEKCLVSRLEETRQMVQQKVRWRGADCAGPPYPH